MLDKVPNAIAAVPLRTLRSLVAVTLIIKCMFCAVLLRLCKSGCSCLCLITLCSGLRLNLRELGPWASHMRWIVWIMACVGTAYVFFFHERYV